MNTIHSIAKIAIFTSVLLTVPLFGDAPSYTYLALGDSISFGYSPAVNPPTPATSFTGYPEIVAVDLNLPVGGEVNASCPGQTSGSFLTGAPDNGCENNGDVPGFKAAFGLHVAYTGTQINFALSQLHANPNINLVTLSIGGNDLLLLQQACATASDFTACVGGKLPEVLSTYAGNLTQILAAIRGAGYTGKLVLSEYSAPNTDPTFVQAVAALNQVMVDVGKMYLAGIADGFTAFQVASAPYGNDPCAAGLLVPLPDGPTPCDVHPTYAGQSLLAGAVMQALNSPPLSTGNNCLYSGAVRGNVTVTAGQNCLVAAGVLTGNVTLAGGTLAVSGATITGNVQAQNGGVVSIGPGTVIGGNLQIQNVPATGTAVSQVCGTTVNGNLQVQNNGIPVAIGSDSPMCAGNVIKGNLQTQNNAGSTVILGNTVTGNLLDQNNTGQTQVLNNSVGNDLQCQNNSLIGATGNTARQKQGQCATF